MGLPFPPGGQLTPDSLRPSVQAVDYRFQRIIPGSPVVEYLPAEAGFKAPEPVHGMGWIIRRGDAEEIVLPGALGSGIFNGVPLEELIGHEFPFEGA